MKMANVHSYLKSMVGRIHYVLLHDWVGNYGGIFPPVARTEELQ